MTEMDRRAADILGRIPFVVEKERMTRRPVFVEFSGTPKAGKTTSVDKIERFLRHNGFKVVRLTEKASAAPIRNKDYILFNVWTACTTLAQIAEEYDRCDSHFVLVDRGLFDALWWFEWMHMTGKITDTEKKRIWDFLTLDPWLRAIDVVLVMKASPDKAMVRERDDLPTDKEGKIMHPVVLQQLNECMERVAAEWRTRFSKIVEIDVDAVEGVTERITGEILQTMEEFLDEEVVVIPKGEIAAIGVKPGLVKDPKVFQRLRECLALKSKVLRKSIAEGDTNSVMVVPCGVIRFNDEVLVLRRREIDTRHRLHDKFVIWAGGHIRGEDRRNGLPVEESCLRRELNEELWIRTDFRYEPIGCVLDTSTERSSRHVGMVFDVVVESPDVAVHLQRDFREFREGRGKSVSGKFFEVRNIERKYIEQMERWSYLLLREHFGLTLPPVAEQQILFAD